MPRRWRMLVSSRVAVYASQVQHMGRATPPRYVTRAVVGGVRSRRAFIVWYLGGLLGAIVVAATAPLGVFLWPNQGAASRARPVAIPLDRALDQFVDGEAFHFDAPANTAFVLADGGGVNSAGDLTYGGFLARAGGRLHCLAITCPHLGCNYALDSTGRAFECPCHGSRFSLSGSVLRGPATSPLSHLAFRPGDQGDTIVIEGVSATE